MEQLISHYRIIKKLGAGGMGEVYLAEDSQLRRKVAIKMLPFAAESDGQARKRLLREAQTAATLDHHHICSIYEIGEANGRSFIVMQYIEGETLADMLKRERLSMHESLKLAGQVADALAEAHARSIIHRDIKPSNIIITPRQQAKVLDFGLAKLVAAGQQIDSQAETQSLLSVQGAVIGTVPYMSPEQVRGLPLDARTDIFSFGVMLYEMLSGYHPFICASGAETISAILTRQPPPLLSCAHEVPEKLQSIVEKCLAKDRAQRYQMMRDVHDDLIAAERAHESRKESANEAALTLTVPLAARATARSLTSWRAKLATPRGVLLAAALAGAMLLTFALYAIRLRTATTSQTPISSLAVLPFTNVNADSEAEYLCDGLAESVINRLSQLPNLKVMSRNSASRYKGREVDALAVGRELSVQAVLTGRVLQRGDALSISLELVNALDGTHLWGEQYERKLADLLTVQSEIALEVSEKLRLRLTGAEKQRLTKHYTDNAEAYRLYLKGRYFWDKRTREGIENAIENYNDAIALDPTYALAYAGLADCYLFPKTGEPPQVTIPKTRALATKALEMDDTLAEAHTTLAFIKKRYDYDWAGAEQGFKRAIELNPNYPIAHQFYGGLLVETGRGDEGLREIHRALEFDPLSVTINWYLGSNLYHLRHYDEAITQFRKTLQMDERHELTYNSLAAAYAQKRMYAEAIATLQKLDALLKDPSQRDAQFGLAYIYSLSGRRSDARQALDELKDTSERQFGTSLGIAKVYVALGERELAFQSLERAYQNRDFGVIFLKVDPVLDPLRDDLRFQDLMRRVGLSP